MWQPIADAEIRQGAWRAIEDIERCLGESGSRPLHDPSLAGGMAGLALFFAYLDAARQGTLGSERALEMLDQSVEALAEADLPPSLYSGFCGVGWVVEHLTRDLADSEDDLSAEIDEALRERLADSGERPPYELVNGMAGFGTYLLERLHRPGAVELLGSILDQFASSVEEAPAGFTWRTLPEWIPPSQRERIRAGYYGLGVAHGVPGVIGFLASAQRAGVRDSRLQSLAEGAVSWVLAQKLSQQDVSVFPSYLIPGQSPQPTRTAWCYGDPGIAAVLLSAARSFHRPEWEAEALALARLAAPRSMETGKVVDACLCHGTTGLGHLFNRLYQATGNLEMKEAALAWYRCALERRLPEEGIAGFPAYAPGEPGASPWRSDPGFLTGAAGVGLALLAAVTDVEPVWDRLLAVSIPPRV